MRVKVVQVKFWQANYGVNNCGRELRKVMLMAVFGRFDKFSMNSPKYKFSVKSQND